MAIKLKWDPVLVYNNRSMAWLHLGEWERAKSDLATVKDMGVDIIALLRLSYSSIADFERRNGVKLPADLAEMLTPQQ